KEKIKKMVIMDSFSGNEPKSTQDLYFNMLNIIEKNKKIPNELIEKIAPIFFSPEIDKNSKLYLNFKESLKNIPEKNIEAIVKMGRIIFGRENSMDLLEQINIPTYFLTGERDIPRPFSEALSMKKLVKNSKIFKIKKAGHISNLENFRKVNKIFKKILK
ncbi:alpha/beta hydrolase, partial [Fusobacterium sp.]|uniref:alpha/beta fold hydrolase n=1 Tax=Fusobacterium sp. TaxID=68766 RepID=UPI00261FA57C